MMPGDVELEIDSSVRPDHAMLLMRYFVALRRDPIRGQYVNRRMEIREALVSALPLPMHYAGVHA